MSLVRSAAMRAPDSVPQARDGTTNAGPHWGELALTYLPRVRTALADSILPFWWRTIDESNGGVFNCWNNAGTRLVSRDKFTWSQGRFAWLWSRLADVVARGGLDGDARKYQSHAAKTVRFLEQH